MTWGVDHGDHSAAPAPLLDDGTVDALVAGADVPADLSHLAAFAAGVRAAGRRRPPQPSAALAALLAEPDPAAPPAETVPARPGRKPPAARPGRRRSALTRIAGAGLAVKIALGASAAAAGVLGAEAFDVLPGSPGRTARTVIGPVTSLDVGEADPGAGSGGRDHGPDDRRPGDARGDGGRHAAPSVGHLRRGPAGDHRRHGPFHAGVHDRIADIKRRAAHGALPSAGARTPPTDGPASPDCFPGDGDDLPNTGSGPDDGAGAPADGTAGVPPDGSGGDGGSTTDGGSGALSEQPPPDGTLPA